jgi:hypothetical protein
MTLLKPSLFVDRLIVRGAGRSVYDQDFHEGLNVIYGENASGKSTILEFIFYVLGGEFVKWKEAALRCDAVTAGIRINGEPLTLSRAVSENRQQPLSIYWGSVDEAIRSMTEGWEVFPYRRSGTKDSFSQVLFRALGMPEVPADESSNITMHQILRLIDEDQMASPQDMFRHDEFDRELTKETVGELICGMYDPQLYADQLRLREADRAFGEAQAALKSLFSALGSMSEDLGLLSVQRELQEALEERAQVFQEIQTVSLHTQGDAEETDSEQLDRIRDELASLGQEIVVLEERIQSLGFQVAEAHDFIASLEGNLEALKQSELTHSELGAISFSYCPACFTPVDEPEGSSTCPLCKSPIDESAKRPHQLRMRRELEMQLRESREIQKEREQEVSSAKLQLIKASARRTQLRSEYRAKQIVPTSKQQQRLQELYERAGWLERQTEILSERIELANKIDELSEKKASLNSERSILTDRIEAARRAQDDRRGRAYTLLSELTRELLNSDLEREDSFVSAQHVDFSFGKERITVDGSSVFAASSSVYLKNSFLFAILLASTEDGNFRFPRLLMLDGIEDKGMEEDRIHHFQNLMQERSSAAKARHQVIFTAQTLSEELLNAGIIVGTRYSHEKKTLDL